MKSKTSENQADFSFFGSVSFFLNAQSKKKEMNREKMLEWD